MKTIIGIDHDDCNDNENCYAVSEIESHYVTIDIISYHFMCGWCVIFWLVFRVILGMSLTQPFGRPGVNIDS